MVQEVLQGPQGSPLSSSSIVSELIEQVRSAQLAPHVDAFAPATWIYSSHFKAADYQASEGLPDWDQASSAPKQVQRIRTMLVNPSPTQPRTDMLKDTDKIGRMILNVASHDVQTPLLVRKGESGEIIVVSGHTRRFCAINAGKKFLPCVFQDPKETLSETRTLISEVSSNSFRRDMNDTDKANAYLRILETAQREFGTELTTQNAIDLLHLQLDVSKEEAIMYLHVTRLNPQVRELLASDLITLERASAISESISNPDVQLEAAVAFIARDGTDSEIVERFRMKGERGPVIPAPVPAKKPPSSKSDYTVGDVRIRLTSPSVLTREAQIQTLERLLNQLKSN